MKGFLLGRPVKIPAPKIYFDIGNTYLIYIVDVFLLNSVTLSTICFKGLVLEDEPLSTSSFTKFITSKIVK